MGIAGKLAYSSGSITAAIPQYAIQTYIWFYYLTVLHMDPIWMASATTVWTIWNAINDPLFGYVSDRTLTRWGRRVPWIAVFAFPLAISMFFVFGPPGDANTIGNYNLFVWLTLSLLFYDTCYTIVVLNWTSLFPEMFQSNKERSQMSVMRQVFSVFGLITGTAIPPLLASTMGWPGVGLAIGIVSAIFAFLSLAGSHEKPEFKEKTLPILQAMRSTFSNRSFVIFVSYNFMVQYIIAVALGALPFFVAYVVGGNQTILFLILFLVAMPVFAVWNHINVTRGPRASAIITLLWVGIVMMGILFISDFTSALVVIAIAAAGVGGFMILPDILISFTIDADELKTGVRREGAYFGFNAFVMRFSVIAQSWTYALLLNASGFDENLPVQPPSAILAIRLLLSIVPLIAAIIGAVIVSRYPFHGQAFKELQQQIEVLHTQKKEHTS